MKLNEILCEALMTFGSSAYPKFGHVVILAGGAGSGKGFQLRNLLGIEGRVFNVDEIKNLALKSKKFSARVKTETGIDMGELDLKDPDNVGRLHDLLANVYGITGKREATTYTGILAAPEDRKPNLIFDVTLKELSKLESITRNAKDLGYKKEHIHIVWIINDIEVAKDQNASRDRVVPDEIFIDTHEGVSLTMRKILNMGENLYKYMDGVIYISFNQLDVDTSVASKGKWTGEYLDKSDYVKVKEMGEPQLSTDELSDEIYDKIKSYVPQTDIW